MKILMTTWEFPPIKVGGIGSHCFDLCKALSEQGAEVHVLTFGEHARHEIVDNISVHRIPSGHAPDTISWATFLGHQMEKKAIELDKEENFDVVHAHDWMMVPAGVGIKKTLDLPMVFTLHSTEHGRSGIHDSYTKMINDLEWYGTYEANEIITVGQDFYKEVRWLFNPPEDKLHYIPNGVDVDRFDTNTFSVDKNDYALDWEKIVLFVGRLTHQKGVEHLIKAMPAVLNENSDAKFVLAGGGAIDHYRGIAHAHGIGGKALFTGYVPEHVLLSLFKTSEVAVAPSIYEPFGIVALEAGAARKPIVGSFVGGLKETIVHETTGLHSYPADYKSIASQLNAALSDPFWAKRMGLNGRKRVEKNYRWNRIAALTFKCYLKAQGTIE
jgi:glycosyltransferase involved in cell wall biosynthesis